MDFFMDSSIKILEDALQSPVFVSMDMTNRAWYIELAAAYYRNTSGMKTGWNIEWTPEYMPREQVIYLQDWNQGGAEEWRVVDKVAGAGMTSYNITSGTQSMTITPEYLRRVREKPWNLKKLLEVQAQLSFKNIVAKEKLREENELEIFHDMLQTGQTLQAADNAARHKKEAAKHNLSAWVNECVGLKLYPPKEDIFTEFSDGWAIQYEADAAQADAVNKKENAENEINALTGEEKQAVDALASATSDEQKATLTQQLSKLRSQLAYAQIDLRDADEAIGDAVALSDAVGKFYIAKDSNKPAEVEHWQQQIKELSKKIPQIRDDSIILCAKKGELPPSGGVPMEPSKEPSR